MNGSVTGVAVCAGCGSALRPNAPFCPACGQAVTHRDTATAGPSGPSPAPLTVDHVKPAGRGLRCCSALLNLAAMLSPVLPLTLAALVLGVADVVFLVLPVAALAVWLWMALWQGYSGMTFGGALLGLRCVRSGEHTTAGVGASVLRGLAFAGTAGLAGLPVLLSAAPTEGVHDRLSRTTLLDVTRGANPLGPQPQPSLRRRVDRSLRKVESPVPLGAGGGR